MGTETLSGAELATAFDGKFERTGVSVGYHVGLLLVATAMVLLPVVYLAIIALTAMGVMWYASHAGVMFEHVRGRAIILVLVAYLGPIIAGGVLVVFMILPLFWRSKKGARPMWVDQREEPLLYAYVEKLCDAMRVPRPVRIDVIAAPNASAHIDNGLFGIFHRRLVLTIGLPLAAGMTLRQFTGVLAHEFGHFAQGSSMRLSYVVHRINAWFARLAWGHTGVDDMLDSMTDAGETHWAIALVILLCRMSVGIVRLILKGLALVSHLLSMHLSRQAEYDADRRAARVVGSTALEDALQMLPFVDVAHTVAVNKAQASWSKRLLPDDIVLLTDAAQQYLPEPLKDSVTSQILSAEASWFDTHPPLYKRVAALKKAKLQGVLKLQAPATVLFKDFPELCKMATIDFYQGVLGQALQAEHLAPTDVSAVKGLRLAAAAK